MEDYVEEIVSKYLDHLNAGTAPPPDQFLAEWPDLASPTRAGLAEMLSTLLTLRADLPLQVRRRASWQRLESALQRQARRRTHADGVGQAKPARAATDLPGTARTPEFKTEVKAAPVETIGPASLASENDA